MARWWRLTEKLAFQQTGQENGDIPMKGVQSPVTKTIIFSPPTALELLWTDQTLCTKIPI